MTALSRFGVVLFAVCLFAGGGTVHAQQSIEEARTEPLGTRVTVEGTVTRAYGAYVRLQDASGPTGASALVLRQASGPNSEAFQSDIETGTIRPGTVLEVTGRTSAFYGLIQINGGDLDSYSVQDQGAPPAPQAVSLADLSERGEEYESELLRIEGMRFVRPSGSFEAENVYTVEDGEGRQFEVRVQGGGETAVVGEPVPKGVFTFEGVLGQFHGEDPSDRSPNEGYQLIPVRESDFQPALSFRFTRLYDIAQEGGESASVQVQALNTEGQDVSVTATVGDASTATTGADVGGFDGPQSLTFTGSDPAPKTLTFDPLADGEREGVERLEVVLSSADGPIASPRRFTFWILDAPSAQGVIAAGDSGHVLLDQLREAYGGASTLGYDVARDTLYRRVYNESGVVEGFYSGYSATVDPSGGDASDQALDEGVNTEHLWPRSQGAEEEPALSDMHILVPARDVVNTARSNYAFGEIPDAETDQWYFEDQSQSMSPETDRSAWSELDDSPPAREDRRFEPRHRVKGDVARAAFYFKMAYPDRANRSFFEAQRETLLEWHRQDPVDATEMRRALMQASHQGNTMNPFVMDSTLADRVYGRGRGPSGDLLSLREAHERTGGETAAVEGVVTRVGTGGLYLQDETAGLYVEGPTERYGPVAAGARLEVAGTLRYDDGLLELIDIPEGGYRLVSQDNPVPDPVTLSLGEIVSEGESYEAELVRVENFSVGVDGDETFQGGTRQEGYVVRDGTGTLELQVPTGSALDGEPIPAGATFEGPLGQFNGEGNGAEGPDSGYQLVAYQSSDLSERIPAETTVDVTRTFGDASTGAGYRLVALPGRVDRSVSSTLDGEVGGSWQAYWDDGSEQDYFVPFDKNDPFAFRPGRGFWILSTNDWSVEATLNTVEIPEGAATIPVHEGWNIISNPLPVNIPWGAVEEANGGTLQPLWKWDGTTFQETPDFSSAAEGEAFYFLNDRGLEQLSIPIGPAKGGTSVHARASTSPETTTLVAHRGPDSVRVHVGERRNAREGKDRFDVVAPPGRFSALSMTVEGSFEEDVPDRYRQLRREMRSPGERGQTYTLSLQADTTGPVTLRVESMPRGIEGRLVNTATGRRRDVSTKDPVTISAGPEATKLTLLLGDPAYVASRGADDLPETLTVQPPRPNPFREHTTLTYAVPDGRDVRIVVYDLLGRRVQTLVDGHREAGFHQVTWDGRKGGHYPLASGTYLIRWSSGGEQHVEQVVLVR